MMFDHYEIDREMLLNKTGDVTVDGEYVTPFRDPNKRFGASLGKYLEQSLDSLYVHTTVTSPSKGQFHENSYPWFFPLSTPHMGP
jgi:hypothetical protein